MNILKLIKINIILIFILIISNNISFAQFGGGAGTQAEPYEIHTIEHLMELSDSVEYSPSNDAATDYNWSRGKYFILKNDITDSVRFNIGLMSGYYNYEEYFQGDFNGNDKQIILALDGKQKLINGVWTRVFNHFLGLFSGMRLANVYDLNLTGYIRGESYMGGICGINVRSNISNCVNRCNIENYEPTSSGDNRSTVGGFCGEAYLCTISDCVNYGNITAYGMFIGGIAGYTNSATATNCTNYGNITGSVYFTAGIFGYASGVLYGVTNAAGCLSCHNYGDVSCIDGTGGIIGCALQSVSISNCTNSGTITAETGSGGIAGHSHMGIEISHCINIGTVQGNSIVGGITGGHGVPRQDSGGSVNNCHNAGLVIGKNIVGGIQGCCWGGEISNSLNTGVVVGETNVGGIVGEAKKDDIIQRDAVIKNCHYDKQMCIYGGIAGNDVTGQAEGYLTKELIGNNLQAKLSSTDWTFNNANLYPTLKHFENDSIAFVASSPVYLYDSDVADFDRQNKVRTDFKVNLENDVKWDRIIGNVDIVNDDGLLRNNGRDTLVCSIGNCKKLVPINIELSPNYNVKFTIWATEHKQIAPTETNYSIPIYIKSNAKTLQAVTIKKLIIEIDSDIFYAKYSDNGTLSGKNQNEITIENIKIPKLNVGEEVILFNIIGDVLLGNIDSSKIIIDTNNIEYSGISATKPELKDGYITLNICHEGSDRFVKIAGNSPSLIIKNNPVEDILEVECNVVESGKYTLGVVDMAGRSVNVEEFVANVAGAFLFEIDARQFSSGRYMVVLGALSGRRWTSALMKE